MTRKNISITLLIVVLVACMALAGCVTGGGITPADVTATYGAEQFHIQLTAQAGQN